MVVGGLERDVSIAGGGVTLSVIRKWRELSVQERVSQVDLHEFTQLQIEIKKKKNFIWTKGHQQENIICKLPARNVTRKTDTKKNKTTELHWSAHITQRDNKRQLHNKNKI